MLDKSFVSITREFGDKALGVLDIGYMDSSEQTYSMLSAPLKDFNNKTSIEIAHDAGYIGFIAHPCCQKWLTRKLFGAIQVKELDLGFLTLPNWFKVSLYRLFAVSRSQHCHVFRSYERLVTSIAWLFMQLVTVFCSFLEILRLDDLGDETIFFHWSLWKLVLMIKKEVTIYW